MNAPALITAVGHITAELDAIDDPKLKRLRAIELVEAAIQELEQHDVVRVTIGYGVDDARSEMRIEAAEEAEALAEYRDRPSSVFRLELYEQDRYMEGAFAQRAQAA